MQRFAPYLGALAALILGVFFVSFYGSVTVTRAPSEGARTASSTLSVLPPIEFPDVTLPSAAAEQNAPSHDSSPAVEQPAVPAQEAPTQTPTAPEPAPAVTATPEPAPTPTPAPSSGSTALNEAASALRGALVNIICYVPAGIGLHSITGSGIIIDPKGIILTNAHVAQYFLLADRGASCTIRAGSPAVDKYKAELAYLPAAWIAANASLITQAAPSGTGELDFALLAITKSATSAPLPSMFPSVPLAENPPSTGTPVVIASYGAQFLPSSQVQSSLYPTVVFGSVKEVYTFDTNTVDVFDLGGSAAAQEGSSGGGAADASGELIGTITTSTVTGDTASRSLDAITASYIRAAYASQTGSAFDLLLAKQPADAVSAFAPQISGLEAMLTAQLP